MHIYPFKLKQFYTLIFLWVIVFTGQIFCDYFIVFPKQDHYLTYMHRGTQLFLPFPRLDRAGVQRTQDAVPSWVDPGQGHIHHNTPMHHLSYPVTNSTVFTKGKKNLCRLTTHISKRNNFNFNIFEDWLPIAWLRLK